MLQECMELFMPIMHIIAICSYDTKLSFKVHSNTKNTFYITFHLYAFLFWALLNNVPFCTSNLNVA